MEVLCKLVYKACEVGLLEGFQVGSSISRGLLVSHILFVDDTLIFCVLLLFEAMSGLRVILSKSSLIPIGEILNIHHLTSFFDCGVRALRSTYLGLSLGASFKCKAVWGPVVERFQKRLGRWKSKMLSKGGRLTLLQRVQFRRALLVTLKGSCEISYGLSMIVTEVFIRLVGTGGAVPRRVVVWELDCFE